MHRLQGSWIWYELVTPEPAKAADFYGKIVGWRFLPPMPANPGYGFVANADGSMTGGVLALDADMARHGMKPCWLGYIGVDDCDAAVDAIKARNGQCLMPPRDIAMAGRIAMVADPGGVPFYVMTPKPPPGAPAQSTAFSPRLPGRCAWNELLAADRAQALDFYTSLFGWTLPGAMDMGAMGSYDFIAHEGEQVGAIMQKPPQAPTPHWHHYFRVDGIEAAATTIAALGGTVMFGPYEVPGGDHMIQCIDPQGAPFELVGKK